MSIARGRRSSASRKSGKVSHSHVNPPVKTTPGNVYAAFLQLHQRAAMLRLDRREADTAIAEHRGGHAVPARWPEQRIPNRLPVIMRVHVDPAGRYQQARCIDLAPSRAKFAADLDEALAR